MKDVRKWKVGWIEFDSSNGDVIRIRSKDVAWIAEKADSGRSWIVIDGAKETYWEVRSTPEEIYTAMQ